MKKKNYFPKQDAERLLWLQNFSAKLSTYSGKYGISAADVTDMQASSSYFAYCLDFRNKYDNYAGKLVRYKRDLIEGELKAAADPLPVAPSFATAPAAVPAGIYKRVSAIVATIKSKTFYSEADGRDLGIEAPATEIDLATVKPTISVRLVAGGHPEILWNKQGMDAIEIHKDNGSGEFQLLDIDITPHYTDMTPLPAQPQTWRYKAIYRVDNDKAGLWSDVISTTVSA